MTTVPTSEPPAPAPLDGVKCRKHWYHDAAGRCEDCGIAFCEQCLAPPVRDGGALRCVDCALVAAGVRVRPRHRGRRARRHSDALA